MYSALRIYNINDQKLKRKGSKTALYIQCKIRERQRYAVDKDRCEMVHSKDVALPLCVWTGVKRWLCSKDEVRRRYA